MKLLAAKRPEQEPVWPFDHKRFNQLFIKFSEMSGVDIVTPHPYSLRHGGASHDALHQRRPLQEIKSRGRWMADESVRRYNKHARVLKEVTRLSEETRSYGMWAMDHMNDLLDNRIVAKKPPTFHSKRLRKRHAKVESSEDDLEPMQLPKPGGSGATRLKRARA